MIDLDARVKRNGAYAPCSITVKPITERSGQEVIAGCAPPVSRCEGTITRVYRQIGYTHDRVDRQFPMVDPTSQKAIAIVWRSACELQLEHGDTDVNAKGEIMSELDISLLIDDLAKEDAGVRMTARAALVELGHSAVAALVTTLHDPRQHVRWEAAKTLKSIADANTAPALVAALHDEDADVRWVAGEALVKLGDAGLASLLGGLIRHSHSVDFCRGAHHVLHDLAQQGRTELLTPVIKALDGPEPGVAAPPAALEVLRLLTFGESSE